MSIDRAAFSGVSPLRKEGDSNPRYGNPYGSLANCWFQPLTHPSKMRVQRYDYFFVSANFWATFFEKSYLKATTSDSSESK